MKKVMSCVISLFLLLIYAQSALATGADVLSGSIDYRVFDKTLLYLSEGKGDDEIGYIVSETENVAPESFVVDEDAIYILDSVKNRILMCCDGETVSYDLSPCEYPTHMTYGNDRFYVIDGNVSVMYIFNKNTLQHDVATLPAGINSLNVYRLSHDSSGKIILVTHDLYRYELDSNDFSWCIKDTASETALKDGSTAFKVGQKIIPVETETCTIPQFIEDRQESLLYIGVYEYVPNVPIIQTEYTLRAYDENGTLKGCTLIDYRDAFTFPITDIYIDESGEVYLMLCREDGVSIVKPHMGKTYRSNMNELEKRVEEIMQRLPEETKNGASLTDRTRASVRSYAEAAANHTWTIQAENKTIRGSLELPNYVSKATPGSKLTGIPYSRGGYFSNINTFDTRRSTDFTDGLLYTTGNITASTVSGTTGLDCSGFASYAYGLSHNTTTNFNSMGYYVNSGASSSGFSGDNIANLNSMDFLIRYNVAGKSNHVVIFDAVNTSMKYWIYDANSIKGDSSTYGRATRRTVELKYLGDFVTKTLYSCGGTGSCTDGATYYSNSYTHWKKCSECGENFNNATHTWVAYGTQFRCSVCLKVSATAPGITSELPLSEVIRFEKENLLLPLSHIILVNEKEHI